MKNVILTALASLVLSLGISSAHASVLDTATTAAASQADLYGVFHDRQTNFVFVKLPQGWVFAGQDQLVGHHAVFHDASTGFVFVKLSGGWKFVANVA